MHINAFYYITGCLNNYTVFQKNQTPAGRHKFS